MTIYAFTDGASRGNPGESGIGIILKNDQNQLISSYGGYIGHATNNVAEYSALIQCLKIVQDLECSSLIVHSDSELMVRQMNGEYRVKDADLKVLFEKAQAILTTSNFSFEIRHVSRKMNRDADELANRSINLKRSIRLK